MAFDCLGDFLLPRIAKAIGRPAESCMRAPLCKEKRCRRKNLLEGEGLSTGIFTLDLREQRTRPQGEWALQE
jgi:hypothetical protein